MEETPKITAVAPAEERGTNEKDSSSEGKTLKDSGKIECFPSSLDPLRSPGLQAHPAL